jgi:hypothetical protein
MRVIVSRNEEYQGSTIGEMTVDGAHICYTLEDGYQEKKVYGETRIPAGIYELELQTVGRFHERYSRVTWLPEGMHRGMIHVKDVPGFTGILMHTGNTKLNTDGCLLVGKGFSKHDDGFFLERSRDAYKIAYPVIADQLSAGERVYIEYQDNDR